METGVRATFGREFPTKAGLALGLFLLPALNEAVHASEHFLLPQKAISAWTCSILAAANPETEATDEMNRLFSLGYEYGKATLEAEERGDFNDLSAEDRAKYFSKPWNFTAIDSASDDFRLGAVYKEVLDSTVNDLVQGWTLPSIFSLSSLDRAGERAREEYKAKGCASVQ